jgi:hypothetical protein
MLATYASFLAVLGSSTLVGQAILAADGRREWSPLAPAIGLAALVALAWGAVNLPGRGAAVLAAIVVALVASALYLPGRAAGARRLASSALPVAVIALFAASLPFIVEGRFGILGTGFNPDMSQHLLATERLADGGGNRLISEGYPLGPHALVVGLSELGAGTVHGFGGLTVAVAVAACLAPLTLLAGASAAWRVFGALTIGFAYLVASFLVQGAFKETMQALFLVAFAIGLHELRRDWAAPAASPRALRAIPLAVLAVGSAYTYSFPGLAWLVGAAGAWGAIELALALREGGGDSAIRLARRAAPAVAVGALLLSAALAPEAARMIEFGRFETFDPDGPGLGNLFGRLSPLQALGIWPSGDFRVDPGAGLAPAIAFYAGAALGIVALAIGLRWWLGREERAAPAALAAAAALWAYSLTVGTPYQEAKALALAAPLVSLIAVRALVFAAPAPLALAYIGAAAACAALVLVNGPVGPSAYSPALAELRPALAPGSNLVLAPRDLIRDQHGRDYLVWELRGNRICVAERAPAARDLGERIRGLERVARVLVVEDVGARRGAPQRPEPPPGFRFEAEGPGYTLFESPGVGGEHPGPCPFVSDGQRADPAAGTAPAGDAVGAGRGPG